jgi:hypothetical protein
MTDTRYKDPEYQTKWNAAKYQRDHVATDARNKAWAEANPEKHKAYARKAFAKYKAKNPEKYKAHYTVNNAIRGGRLVRPDVCERCGDTAKIEASHDNYSKPLEVEWLCRPCHRSKDGLSRTPVGGRSFNEPLPPQPPPSP